MTPIISPIWFYFIGGLDNVTIAAGLILIILIFLLIMNWAAEGDIGEIKTWQKVLAIFLVVVLVATPSESTVYKMLVAQNVTYERLEAVGDTVEDVYNDIMDLFDKEDDDE